MVSEHQMVAALLALDIRTFAKAFPDNAQIQLLSKKATDVIEDKAHRERRYRAGGMIYSLAVEKPDHE